MKSEKLLKYLKNTKNFHSNIQSRDLINNNNNNNLAKTCKHLSQCSEEVELLNNIIQVRYLRTIVLIEKQQQIHNRIRHQSKPSKSNILYFIDIPIDNKMALNEIPKN